MKEVITSEKYALDLRDWAEGFVFAFLAAFIATAGQALEAFIKSPTFEIDKVSLVLSAKAGFAAGAVYLWNRWKTERQRIITSNEQGTGS